MSRSNWQQIKRKNIGQKISDKIKELYNKYEGIGMVVISLIFPTIATVLGGLILKFIFHI